MRRNNGSGDQRARGKDRDAKGEAAEQRKCAEEELESGMNAREDKESKSWSA